ncbi:MAG: ElyC/SanA/YdcF family protein, partial [Opitutaceae bacterium]
TGGLTNNGWGPNQWSYAEMAEEVLVDDGVPKDRIIRAESTVARSQRTFASAAAAWRTLRTRGLLPPAVNLFTLGAHARRSRLIYAKAFGDSAQTP